MKLRSSFCKALLLGTIFAFPVSVNGADSARSPFNPDDSVYTDWAPRLVDDELMPSQGEVEAMRRWTAEAFAGSDRVNASVCPTEGVEIVVERQDYSSLQFDATCTGDAFNVGNVPCAKGLGTHANSRLAVYFPEKIVAFNASVGINPGGKGSVICGVELDGKEFWQSDVVRSGDKAVELALNFDEPTDKLVLTVDTTEDGPQFDQLNWLDPIAVGVSGKTYSLDDDGFVRRLNAEIPFSFKYGGISSREFLKDWDFSVDAKSVEGRTRYTWTDKETNLSVTAEVRSFDKFAAADWVLYFTNNGTENTKLIEDVQVLDASFTFGLDTKPVAIHTLLGDSCNEDSWRPTKYSIKTTESRTFAPVGGRSSDGVFPFWNFLSNDVGERERTDGFFCAIGWTGQWNATFERPKSNSSDFSMRAGLEKISTVLYPGETIRSPRVLVMPWNGDRMASQALFRRMLMFEYAPKMNGNPVQLEFLAQDFDRYYRKREGWEKVDQQIETAKKAKEVDCTAYWFDAAWFPVGFPNGVGNWSSDFNNFPNGVEELGDALEKMGFRFILWFEPERVAPNTEIATKYPQYVFDGSKQDRQFIGGAKDGLYKLNDPEARKFLTELLLKRIKEFKVGVYRNDFNIAPLPFWREADESDRQGMTETRYIEGLYEMWNRFLSENPGLWIDNCSSGGRRIDLEMTSLGVPHWRSDTSCWPGHPEWDQQHTLGIAQYIPLFSCAAWDSSPYTFRSAANLGAIMQYNFLDPDYDKEQTIKSVREAKTYQKFWYGDFYGLTTSMPGKNSTLAWQLDRPDLNAGLLYFFRQSESPYPAVEVQLRAIDPKATYRVSIKYGYEVDESYEISGEKLQNFCVHLPERRSACVVEYQKL